MKTWINVDSAAARPDLSGRGTAASCYTLNPPRRTLAAPERTQVSLGVRLLRTALLAVMLCACTLSGAELFPLQVGNTWVYRDSSTGHEFTIRVGTPALINDLEYYSLAGYTTKRLLVRINEKGDLVYRDEDREQDLLLTSFEPFEGGWWEAPLRVCDQEGQTQEKRGTHDGAAGPFRDVVEIRYRSFSCADAGVQSEQFAQNIGMVRRIATTIAGLRTYDLVYARVGAMLVDALPHGRFTVTAYPKPDSDSMIVTLRLRTNSPAEVVLPFHSAQEYELQLLDAAGNVLWKWSDGQLFDQAAHELRVSGEWSAKIEISNPLRTNTGPSAEIFTVQAWMTTADAPRFAASVPVIISSNAN